MNIQKIRKLRKRGFSLREICKKLDLSYGPVQRVCSNIKMSKKGLERHSKLNGLTRNISFNNSLNESKVRIISNLLFDGAVYKDKEYHYSIMYINNSKKLIDQFITDMQEIYNTNPSSLENSDNYQRVKYFSKRIYEDLTRYMESFSTSNKNCIIPSKIIGYNKPYKIEILKAFWENEGSVSKEGALSADLKSLKVIKQLSKLHDDFGLKHNISKYWANGWAYKLFLSKTKENYQKFLNLKLFEKADVTKGYNIGKKKLEVLKDYFNIKFSSTIIKSRQQLSYP